MLRVLWLGGEQASGSTGKRQRVRLWGKNKQGTGSHSPIAQKTTYWLVKKVINI